MPRRRTPEAPILAGARRRWEVYIPDWRPALSNELIGRHPGTIGRRKAADRRRLEVELTRAGVPLVAIPPAVVRAGRRMGIALDLLFLPAPRRRRVSLRVVGPFHGGLPDADAPLKSFLDGLVATGYLVSDADEWCDWQRPAFERGPGLVTIITLEDIDPMSPETPIQLPTWVCPSCGRCGHSPTRDAAQAEHDQHTSSVNPCRHAVLFDVRNVTRETTPCDA